MPDANGLGLSGFIHDANRPGTVELQNWREPSRGRRALQSWRESPKAAGSDPTESPKADGLQTGANY